MDNDPDTGNARWLSYDEIADMRGIDRASAIRMARRKHWARQEANDGTTRVAVPGAFFRAKRTKPAAPGQTAAEQVLFATGQTRDKDGSNSMHVSALSDHVRTLREELAAERQAAAEREAQLRDGLAAALVQADKMRDDLAAERIQAARAEGEVDGLKTAAEHLQGHLAQTTRQRDEAQHQLAEVKAAADALKRAKDEAEAALSRLRARGLLARLRNRA